MNQGDDRISTFVPKSNNKQQITIRIDKLKLEKVDDLASMFNLSRSEFIDQCLGFALNSMQEDQAVSDETVLP